MKKLLLVGILTICLMFLPGCNITSLVSQNNQDTSNQDQAPVFQNTTGDGEEQSQDKLFKDIVNLKPSSGVEVTNDGGYYAAAAAGRHITNVYWISPNEFTFRLDNNETSSILKGKIDDTGLKITPILEAPAGSIYINDELNEGKGSVLISWMKEQNLYWYCNKELKEFKNTQYYCISPLQNYIVLFPGDNSGAPKLVDIKSGKEMDLPEEVNHGWPSYASGLCFSPGESRLAYEDWSKEAISIFDLKVQKEMAMLSEDGYSFIEASFSPNGKMIACLKADNNNPPTEIGGEGRNPVGSKLVVYDVEKKKVLTEIDGKPYIWSTSLWSPDGKYLIVNMADITSDEKKGVQIKGEPYLLNASNWKLKKLTTDESGTWLKQGMAWSSNSKKVLVNSVDENGGAQLWAADINMSDELNIKDNQYYILKNKQSGTLVYEVVKLNYKSINKFSSKRNFSLSPGEKYALFTIEEDGMEYIIVSPAE